MYNAEILHLIQLKKPLCSKNHLKWNGTQISSCIQRIQNNKWNKTESLSKFGWTVQELWIFKVYNRHYGGFLNWQIYHSFLDASVENFHLLIGPTDKRKFGLRNSKYSKPCLSRTCISQSAPKSKVFSSHLLFIFYCF